MTRNDLITLVAIAIYCVILPALLIVLVLAPAAATHGY